MSNELICDDYLNDMFEYYQQMEAEHFKITQLIETGDCVVSGTDVLDALTGEVVLAGYTHMTDDDIEIELCEYDAFSIACFDCKHMPVCCADE